MTVSSTAGIDTFRDPAGSLRVEGDRVKRRVRVNHARAALSFLASDLARQWVSQGLMVATTTLGEGALQFDSVLDEDEEIVLEHPRVFFPSYPWEWTPGAWIAAGNLTLDLCESLLGKALILKDATPLNVLFEGAKPVFVDVLSIDKRDPESPIWLAYAQFVRTFLLPLIAHRYLGWPLAASLQRRDGYEPADLYPYLGSAQRWRQPFRSLVTIPYLLEKKRTAAATAAPRIRQSPEIAEAVLRSHLRRLRKMLNRLAPAERASRWSDYPESAGHYSNQDHQQKQAFVRRALQFSEPRNVLDLGANTGVYSRIAASMGASVVAWDTDLAATERNWAQARAEKWPIQPLLVDPARPTPPAGWRNSESLGLLDRAHRNFDCVMALGLIHHLLIADQIPLSEVARLFRDLTRAWAIVEWVPATDPRFADLVRGRDDLYGHLSEEDFLAAMRPLFSIAMSEKLANGRTLYLFQVDSSRG